MIRDATTADFAALLALNEGYLEAMIQKLLVTAFFVLIAISPGKADCQIADAGLEEAVLRNPRLRGPANRMQ